MERIVKTGIKTAGAGEGSLGVVRSEGKEVAIFNVGGKVYAIDNTCPHRAGPLSEGPVQDEGVTCPWHGRVFNVTTGECLNDPSYKVSTYVVREEGGELEIVVEE